MDYDELKEVFFPFVLENDPLKASKLLQIKQWCSAFLKFFEKRSETEVNFFLDTLLDEDCWKETDSIHCIKLERRAVAKKMCLPISRKGAINPLDDFERYQIACWCCLEEEVVNLFDHFLRISNIQTGDKQALKIFVRSLSGDLESMTDYMMEFWSHVVCGYACELNLEGKHLYEYGLDCVLGKMYFKHVEAIEYFWKQIDGLPEYVLNDQQKNAIFMKTVVQASASTSGGQPEIFEFCFSQMSPDMYSEFLKRDFNANRYYAGFNRLRNAFRFDLFQKLFDCLNPNDVSECQFHQWLRLLRLDKCPIQFEFAVVSLFKHMWMKEGFDRHRLIALHMELVDEAYRGKLLITLIQKNHLDLVWSILDEASSYQLNKFKYSNDMNIICSLLQHKSLESVIKFKNYIDSS